MTNTIVQVHQLKFHKKQDFKKYLTLVKRQYCLKICCFVAKTNVLKLTPIWCCNYLTLADSHRDT